MYISVSSQTTLTNPANFFIFALYDASAPLVLLESQVPAKPYGNPIQITFNYNCVSGHIYKIVLFENTTGVVGGIVRNQFAQAVNANSVLVKAPDYLQVDNTPGLFSDTNEYVNTDYIGWEIKLTRNPDTMFPDSAPNITDPNYTFDTLTGRIGLRNDGDVFQPGEKFIVDFVPQIIVAAPGTASNPFASGVLIENSRPLTVADMNKGILLQGTSPTLVCPLPALSAVADYAFFYITSSGGNHINAAFPAAGADTINYGIARTALYLGQGETLRMYKAFGQWQVDNTLQGVLDVGTILDSYSPVIFNTVTANGQLLQRSQYPRLWEYVQGLPVGSITTQTAWNSTFITVDGLTIYPKKGLYNTGDGFTSFGVPLLSDMVLKGTDGSARAGGAFELDQLMDHSHQTPHSANGAAPGGLGYTGGSNPVQDSANKTGALLTLAGAVLSRHGAENKIRTTAAYKLIKC